MRVPCARFAQEDGADGRECGVDSCRFGSRSCLDGIHQFVEKVRNVLDCWVYPRRLLVLLFFVVLLVSELFEFALGLGKLVCRCLLPLGHFLE